MEILVGMDKAWKKEVFSGPRPVFWGSMSTGIGAKAPARAGARTRFSVNLSLTSTRSFLVKTKPTFPLMWGRSLKQNQTSIKNSETQYVIVKSTAHSDSNFAFVIPNPLTWRVLPFLDPSLTKRSYLIFIITFEKFPYNKNKSILLQCWVVLQMSANGFADHGVFAHENDGMISQWATDLLQLLRSDIVCSDNEALGIFIQKLLKRRRQSKQANLNMKVQFKNETYN